MQTIGSILLRSRSLHTKQNNGPAPEAWASIQANLLALGEIVIKDQKLFSARNANMGHFTEKEIDLINDIVKNIDTWSPENMPGLRHQNLALMHAFDEERLPFWTFLICSSAPTDDEADPSLQ